LLELTSLRNKLKRFSHNFLLIGNAVIIINVTISSILSSRFFGDSS
jgi:hypothetical protein